MMADSFPADQKRDPFSEIQLSSTRTRTLKRTLSDEFSPGGNSGAMKSRRVDPERLACRLDPNLVQDMEVLIAQGSRMPPFEIRKELQERYRVDRRHIYDYFHSRGAYADDLVLLQRTNNNDRRYACREGRQASQLVSPKGDAKQTQVPGTSSSLIIGGLPTLMISNLHICSLHFILQPIFRPNQQFW